MSFDDEMRNSKKQKRGKVDTARSLEGLGQGEGRAGAADWGEALPERLSGVVCEISRRGGAASFGLSRDRGAYNLTLFLDGTRKTLWWPASSDLDAELEQVIVYLDSLPR